MGVAFVYCSNLSKSHRRSTVSTAEKEKEQKRLLNPPDFSGRKQAEKITQPLTHATFR